MGRTCKIRLMRTKVLLVLLGVLAAGLVLLACVRAWAQEEPDKPDKKPPAGVTGEKTARPGKKKEAASNLEGAREKEKDEKKDTGLQKKTGDAQQPKVNERLRKGKPPRFTKEQIERAYPVGERLTYNISYKGIHAGTAVLEVTGRVRYKGRQCLRIRGYAKSAGLISKLYNVDDRFQTYVDAETLEPLRSDKRMREGSQKRDQYIVFSPAERTAKYYKKKHGRFVLRREHSNVPFGVQDAFSSLYYLRTMNLKHGKTYSMMIITGKRITKGAFSVTKRKQLKLSGVGKLMGLRLSPKYIEVPNEGKMKPGEGLFVASGDSDVWVDEATGIPLRMYVKVPVIGSIRVELSKKEMLKVKKKKKKDK